MRRKKTKKDNSVDFIIYLWCLSKTLNELKETHTPQFDVLLLRFKEFEQFTLYEQTHE